MSVFGMDVASSNWIRNGDTTTPRFVEGHIPFGPGALSTLSKVRQVGTKIFANPSALSPIRKFVGRKPLYRFSVYKPLIFSRPATSSINAYLLKNKLIAEEISHGHAFAKHVIKQGEFPGFSQYQFQQHIQNILNNPTDLKLLTRGRTAYWDQKTGTVVIRDPMRTDGGTAFKPLQGKNYFDDVLK